MMKLEDFKIGQRFWMSGREWQVMDIATAHILATEIDDGIRAEPSWLNGPPYACDLDVLSVYDLPACFATEAEYLADRQEEKNVELTV